MKMQIGGDQLNSYLESFQHPPLVSIRINPDKISTCPIEGSYPIGWHPHGFFLPERPEFVFDPLFHAGAYYVQEASSMLLHRFFEPKEKQLILDLCAAPGGKSTLLAQAMGEGSVLISNEVVRNRAGILAENMTKWGNPHVWITQMDPSRFSDCKGCFDVILVDAPCSGEGLFRKDSSSISHWSEEAVATCAARQKRILADILPCLKPGGQLIYSTCTFAPQENEENIRWLLDTFPQELSLDPVQDLGEFGALPVELNGEAFAAWRCLPPGFKGEGFFISRLKKTSSNKVTSPVSKMRKRKVPSNRKKANKEVQAFLESYVDPFYQSQCVVQEDFVSFFPSLEYWLSPLPRLKVIQRGIQLGKIRRNEVTPTHALALSTMACSFQDIIPLSQDQALSYLRKNDLSGISAEAGWNCVSYEGVNLGWVKVIGNKGKNQYPINWRIRKGVSTK